jgi:hypothetical protein
VNHEVNTVQYTSGGNATQSSRRDGDATDFYQMTNKAESACRDAAGQAVLRLASSDVRRCLGHRL